MDFCQSIALIRDGQLVVSLTDELQDVIASVREHGKSGSLTLKLKVNPNGDDTVEIVSEVKAVQARPSVGKAIFWTDTGGNLHRRDPRQGDMLDRIPGAERKDN